MPAIVYHDFGASPTVTDLPQPQPSAQHESAVGGPDEHGTS